MRYICPHRSRCGTAAGREQTAHSAISIVEGMNAQKVVDENRDENQRLRFQVAYSAIVFITDAIQRIRRFERRKRREQRLGMTIRISGADVVLYALCLTGHGIVHMIVKDFVQLKNVIAGDRDNVEVLMNDAQCVTISGNFLLIAVTWRGLFFHQLANARACGNNAFDGVGKPRYSESSQPLPAFPTPPDAA